MEPTAQSMPSREKYFHERTDSEKIEKLAEVVEWLSRDLHVIKETMFRLLAHQHGPTGQILAPIIKDQDNPISHFLKNPLNRERAR